MSVMIARTFSQSHDQATWSHARVMDGSGVSEAKRGDLLQIVASALHLIDRELDEDLRPLARVGLAAIREVAATPY